MAFARLFPIAAVNAHDGDLTFFETLSVRRHVPRYNPVTRLVSDRATFMVSRASCDRADHSRRAPRGMARRDRCGIAE